MNSKNGVLKLGLLILVGLIASVISSCGGQPTGQRANFDSTYANEVKPFRFNYGSWELDAFTSRFKQQLSGKATQPGNDSLAVFNYFQSIAQLEQLNNRSQQMRAQAQTSGLSDMESQRAALRRSLETDKGTIEKILAQQVSLTLAESGIYNPAANSWLKITFPPLSFALEPSLNVLVVSPRDKIERMKETIIKPDISDPESDRLETAIEVNNVSALVIPLGGFGATYPSFVIESSDLKYSLGVIAEEWFHQFMAFRPLGFRYVLDLTGIIHDPDIAALNETAVGIAAQEIGDLVYQHYYASYYPAENNDNNANIAPAAPQFDFNAAMRETRLNVDAYLASGQIEKAESYMEEQRQMLVSHGYFIRKLNQAYFAFYGSYAYEGTSVDPIGDEVKQLRKDSPSLEEYIQIASGLTSRQALQEYLTKRK
jgi:hypothetical protein